VNRNNTETIGKHGKVVGKLLYQCISEGLIRGRMVSLDLRTKVHKVRGIRLLIGQTPNVAKFRCALTKKCARYPLWKNVAAWKSRPKFTPLVARFVTNR